MKRIEFKLEKLKKVEEFLGAELYSFYQIGTPNGTFKFPVKEGDSIHLAKEIKLNIGDVIYKNSKGELLLKIS